MIKAKELRYGNYFSIDGFGHLPMVDFSIDFIGNLHQITFLTEIVFHRDLVPDHTIRTVIAAPWQVNPIPLTEEWLHRLGFADATNGYRATGNADPVWRIASPIRGQDIDLYERWDREAWKADGYFLGHFEYIMKYVHQLQNLFFALTGEELTIKP